MNKNTLRIIGKSVLLFLLLFFALDRGIGYFLEKIYFKQTRGDFFQTTYAVEHANEDVLIFGSSRAMHHYVSNILEKGLNLSTYNVGRNGKNILYSYALFDQILTYNHPSIVILDVQPNEFSWKAGEEGEDQMISSLLPYKNLPVIKKNITDIRKSDIILSKIFKTYAYNSNAIQLLGYYYGFMPGIKNIKGYVPLNGSKAKKVDLEDNESGEKETTSVNNKELVKTFEKFLSLAKKKGIKLYVIVSPTAQAYSSESIPELKNITEKFGFNFYDFSKIKQFDNISLFHDNSHLNNKGAIKFTQIVLDSLKKNLNEPLTSKVQKESLVQKKLLPENINDYNASITPNNLD